MQEDERVQLLEQSVLKQAEEQAKAVVERAKRVAARILKNAGKQAGQIRSEGSALLETRRDSAQGRALSLVELEVKREAAKRREALVQKVVDEARATLRQWRERPDADEILERLIGEALRSLGGRSFRVELPPEDAERWGEEGLRRCCARALADDGSPLELELAGTAGSSAGGARIRRLDGNTEVDQSFEARLSRFGGSLRRSIHAELFPAPEGREEGSESRRPAENPANRSPQPGTGESTRPSRPYCEDTSRHHPSARRDSGRISRENHT